MVSDTRQSGRRLSLCRAALAAAIATTLPAYTATAQTTAPSESVSAYNIPASDLASSLDTFSTQSGMQLIYQQELVRGKRAPAVNGQLSWRQALERLLAGSGLQWEKANKTTLVIRKTSKLPASPETMEPTRQERRVKESPDESGAIKDLDKMVVVGSRLGALPTDSALPVRVITREEIERSGGTSIAQVLSYLPEVSVSHAPEGNIGDAGPLAGSMINATSVQLRGLPLGTTLILISTELRIAN